MQPGGNPAEHGLKLQFGLYLHRFKPRNWKKSRLTALNIFMKVFTWAVYCFGLDLLHSITSGYFRKYIGSYELRLIITTTAIILDFAMTKYIFGPQLTGLHHGFRRNEDEVIEYRFYAERDLESRYSQVDTQTFFTSLTLACLVWMLMFVAHFLILEWSSLLPISIALAGVYGNLYAFVQARYNRQWSMRRFFGNWLQYWIVELKYQNQNEGNNGVHTICG